MELKESLSLVAKLVLDSMGEIKEEQIKTQMGVSLFNYVKKELSKKDQKKEIISEEVDSKIRYLKAVESQGGISWLDIYSWNLFPSYFQNLFIELLDPLIIWQGVFVLKERLDEVEPKVWRDLPTDLSVYELRDLNCYQLAVIGSDKSFYDHLTQFQFQKKRKWFESQCIRSIGNTGTGIVIKEWKKQ